MQLMDCRSRMGELGRMKFSTRRITYEVWSLLGKTLLSPDEIFVSDIHYCSH